MGVDATDEQGFYQIKNDRLTEEDLSFYSGSLDPLKKISHGDSRVLRAHDIVLNQPEADRF